MLHLDLFSGIGGFAYAADQVFGDVEHIFCDTDPFCQAVLKKHWPEALIYGDIKQLNPDTLGQRLQKPGTEQQAGGHRQLPQVALLTGGFPCQPFSAAGVRRGTADERYLWPEMLRVIRLTHPTWVIAENVRGLLTWQQGVVFEQVCSDLENEGYEVQAFIIPAAAVNAPHRRDRIWFIANRTSEQKGTRLCKVKPEQNRNVFSDKSWNKRWLEVATKLCRVDDGLPARMDGSELSAARHRRERLKALGNAIVPQVAMQIMEAIKEAETQCKGRA